MNYQNSFHTYRTIILSTINYEHMATHISPLSPFHLSTPAALSHHYWILYINISTQHTSPAQLWPVGKPVLLLPPHHDKLIFTAVWATPTPQQAQQSETIMC